MASSHIAQPWHRPFLVGAVLCAVLVPSLATRPARAAVPACPTAIPVSDLAPGTTGTGLTVARGVQPAEFAVEVLGVLEDGAAPGRDLIVVDTSGAVIDDAGGIWSGMSGSPVYLGDPADGRLIGAVAYGFSEGPSSIGGLTPAADLLELAALETAALGSPAAGTAAAGAAHTALSGGTQRLAAAAEPRAGAPGAGLRRLVTPLAVSGVDAAGRQRLQAAADRSGLNVLVTGGGTAAPAASSAPGAAAAPAAGENFAAALSSGDVTSAAIGTTTFTCEGQTVAFAHPLFGDGRTALAAHTANAVTVVDDPASGPFKLANLAGSFGTVDQDRTAGLRAGAAPRPAPIAVTSEVVSTGVGRARTGRTEVVRSADLPLLASEHLLANIVAVDDRAGPGSATATLAVSGTVAGGPDWRYQRSEVFASASDIGFEVAFTSFLEALSRLAAVDGLAFTEVTTGVTVTPEVRRYELGGLRVAVGGGEARPVAPEGPLTLPAGAQVAVTAELTGPGDPRAVQLTVSVPADATGGTLVVEGGGASADAAAPSWPAAEPQATEDTASVPEVLAELSARPMNSELIARFEPIPAAPGQPAAGGDGRQDREILDRVVEGVIAIPVSVAPASTATDVLEVREVAGGDRVATAVAVSSDTFAAADRVVLARADTPADALAGAPLAASLDAPILLTERDGLRAEIAAELARLGATGAVVLGGEAAVGPEVVAALQAEGLDVERIAGGDRFDTARLLAERIGGTEVYVAQGGAAEPERGWPDALSVSALAASQLRPILLVDGPQIPAPTRQALDSLGVTAVTVVGGEAVVSPALAEELGRSAPVTRLSGATRFETSVEVARRAVSAGAGVETVTLATGWSFPDALAAGPAAAHGGGLLLLLDGHDPAGSAGTHDYLAELRDQLAVLRFLGGDAAISGPVRSAVTAAIAPSVAIGPPSTIVAPPPPPPPG